MRPLERTASPLIAAVSATLVQPDFASSAATLSGSVEALPVSQTSSPARAGGTRSTSAARHFSIESLPSKIPQNRVSTGADPATHFAKQPLSFANLGFTHIAKERGCFARLPAGADRADVRPGPVPRIAGVDQRTALGGGIDLPEAGKHLRDRHLPVLDIDVVEGEYRRQGALELRVDFDPVMLPEALVLLGLSRDPEVIEAVRLRGRGGIEGVIDVAPPVGRRRGGGLLPFPGVIHPLGADALLL